MDVRLAAPSGQCLVVSDKPAATIVEDATSELATKADLREAVSDFRTELYRALWIFSGVIVGTNLTALGIATGVIIALN